MKIFGGGDCKMLRNSTFTIFYFSTFTIFQFKVLLQKTRNENFGIVISNLLFEKKDYSNKKYELARWLSLRVFVLENE